MGRSNLVVEEIRKAVDRSSADLLHSMQAERGHLGGSQIGERCVRKVWYSFRRAYQEKHTGRLMRLFHRGHQEEHRVMLWLRSAGFEVRATSESLWYHPESDSYLTLPWEEEPGAQELVEVTDEPKHVGAAELRGIKLKQWSFSDFGGHFGGSCDGMIRGPYLEGWGMVEFKTMNDKSYKETCNKGVLSSKPVYWAQMQVYMGYFGLPWCLFIAVNKNDDEIYYELIPARPELGEQYRDLARKVILATTAPPKLSNDPSWFECRYCAFREICHYQEPPMKSCRSCVYSEAVLTGDKAWQCNRYHLAIPEDFLGKGCDDWTFG